MGSARRDMLGAFICALLFFGCHKEQPAEPTPLLVTLAQIQGTGAQEQSDYTGTVEAAVQVVVRSQVNGTILAIKGPKPQRPWQSGDRIKKGDILLKVDDSIYSRKLDEAKSQYESTRAQRIDADGAYKRNQELYSDDGVSKAELDRSRADRDSTRADQAAALHGVKEAKKYLQWCTIESPADALVLERKVEEGDLLQVGAETFMVGDVSSMKVTFGVGASKQNSFKVGSEALIVIPGLDHRHIVGKVSRVGAMADPQTRLFDVEVKVDNAAGDIKSGMVAKLQVTKEAAKKSAKAPLALEVPLRALVRPPGKTAGTIVYVFAHSQSENTFGVAKATAVEVQGLTARGALVTGVAEGSRVIVRGSTMTRDGQSVRVIR